MNEPLFQLKDLKKYFPVRKGFLSRTQGFVKAVDDVTLTIRRQENWGVVGESGSGKSTLAKLLLKFFPVDQGSILFKGEDTAQFQKNKLRHYRKNIQMVFQDPYSSLDPRYTVRRILQEAIVLDSKSYASFTQREKRMQEILEAVGLKADMLNRYPHEFSGGERQRIAIARALIVNPQVLILDEAVSSLDVLVQEQILNLLLQLQKQFDVTYVFISHNLKVVKRMSQRIAVMHQGKIVELGSTEDIFNNPLHLYTRELLSAAVDYKVMAKESIVMNPHARLVDQGGGHCVLV